MLLLLNDVVRRVRQHHGIEHATIHLLSSRFPQLTFAGYSDPLGFTIYGDVTEENVRRAVGDALLRLQAGDSQLAIHPNCGTNLATSAFLATSIALLSARRTRGSFPDRFATTLVAMVAVLIVAKPLGIRLQRYTTSAEVADRWVAEVRQVQFGKQTAFRVLFD